jgi:hypothetical protein
MLTEMKQFASEIRDIESEVDAMKQENVLLGMEKLKQVFEVAKPGLHFEGVFRTASKYGTPIEKREYYYNTNGELLKGILIDSCFERMETIEGKQIEEYRECFLLESGNLNFFYTTHEWKIDRKYSRHHLVSRIEDPVHQSAIYYDFVIRRIDVILKNRKMELEDQRYFMQDKLDKIQGIVI